LKPQEELERFSDIRFEFVENRSGRRVESITFYIYPNAPEENKRLPQRIRALRPTQEPTEPIILVEKTIETPPEFQNNQAAEPDRKIYQAKNAPPQKRQAKTSFAEPEKVDENLKQDAADKLYLELEPKAVRQFGVSPRAFMELVDQHDENSIRQAVRVTERALKEGKVKNVAGFFVEAVKRHFTDVEEEKQRRRQTIDIKKQRAETLKKEGETLLAEKALKVNDRIRQLLGEQPHATDDAIAQVNAEYSLMIETIAKQKGRALELEDYRKDDILRGLVIGTIVRMNRPYFEDILTQYDQWLTTIQSEIKSILQ
jgi:hypothetical protein